MNFKSVLAHHLIDHKLFDFMVGPINLGLSPLIITMWVAAFIRSKSGISAQCPAPRS